MLSLNLEFTYTYTGNYVYNIDIGEEKKSDFLRIDHRLTQF